MSLDYLAQIASLELNSLFLDGFPKIIIMNENKRLEMYLNKSLIGLIFQGHRKVNDNLYLDFNQFIPYLEYLMTNWKEYEKMIFKNNQKMDIFSFFKDIEKIFPNISFQRRNEIKDFFLFSKTAKTNVSYENVVLEIHYPQEVNENTMYLWFEYLRALIVLHLNNQLSKQGYVIFEPCQYGTRALKAITQVSKYNNLRKNYEDYFGKKLFENLNEEPMLYFNFYR